MTWYESYTAECGFECCDGEIEVSGYVARMIAEEGWKEPSLCEKCKEFFNSHSDETLTCRYSSSHTFEWSVGSQRKHDLNGWGPPTTCYECRALLDCTLPQTLSCAACGDSFEWSAVGQLYAKIEERDRPPNLCKPCRARLRELNDQELDCRWCGRNGVPFSRWLHLLVSTGKAKQPTTCLICKEFIRNHPDQQLSCEVCSSPFTWTSIEQLKDHQKEKAPPRYCSKRCRQVKKLAGLRPNREGYIRDLSGLALLKIDGVSRTVRDMKTGEIRYYIDEQGWIKEDIHGGRPLARLHEDGSIRKQWGEVIATYDKIGYVREPVTDLLIAKNDQEGPGTRSKRKKTG